ncbi:hypothetical protein CFP56_024388 [Quercus suber]|uniref:Uncharacterized protein n=1 Tax=Quercus suber TaxID=58331 RepID=A0AAW0MBW9_QUESU
MIPFEWLEETTPERGVINVKGIFAPVSEKMRTKELKGKDGREEGAKQILPAGLRPGEATEGTAAKE